MEVVTSKLDALCFVENNSLHKQYTIVIYKMDSYSNNGCYLQMEKMEKMYDQSFEMTKSL